MIRLLIPVFCLIAVILVRYQDRFLDSTLRITFFDVGQGDSSLVQFPGGKTLLIDAGGGFGDWDIGADVLYAELSRLGILTLDAALVTHPDADHAYGFHGILRELTVRELWVNQVFLTEHKPILDSLLSLAREKKTTLHSFSKLATLHWNGVNLELLPLTGESGDRNNRPLLLTLTYGPCKILFSADIEAKGEATLKLPPVDLLKVPHHGSRTSSTDPFLDQLRPQIAVISTGEGNQYGHPHLDVLNTYRRKNIRVLRTDFHGFVSFTFERNGSFRCRNFLGDCGNGLCRAR